MFLLVSREVGDTAAEGKSNFQILSRLPVILDDLAISAFKNNLSAARPYDSEFCDSSLCSLVVEEGWLHSRITRIYKNLLTKEVAFLM